jgi:hypothetical protein
MNEVMYKDKELNGKMVFLNLVGIFLGRKTASDEERLQSMNVLFDFLLGLRAGKRIKGEFVATPDIDSRISKLERDYYKLLKMFEELKTLLKGAGMLR